jgi:hypothetical protein
MRLLDYDYGSALGSNKVHPTSESAIRGALVRGNSPMNSLGLRTELMLECSESLATLAEPDVNEAMRDGWPDCLSPLWGRHPGEDEVEPEGDEIEDDDGIVGDDFDDDDEDDEEFDDEDFEDEDEEDIDEGLDDEIDDIDVDDDEDDDFDDDDDLDELDDEDDEDLDDL